MDKTLRLSISWILLIAAFFVIVYGPYIVHGGLLLDDLGFIHPELTHSTYLSYQRELSLFVNMTARPISALLHGIAYWNFGSNAMLFHSVNLGLFLSSIVLFFLAIQRIYSYRLAILAAILAVLYPYSPATSFASIMMNSNLGALFWTLALYLATRTFSGKPLAIGLLLLLSALSYESFVPLFFLIPCAQIVMHRYSFKSQYWHANLAGMLLALAMYGLYKTHLEQWLFQTQFTRVHTDDLGRLLERTRVIASHAFKVMFFDAGPITRKSLDNLHTLEWGCITLIGSLAVYIVYALYKLNIPNGRNTPFSSPVKSELDKQSTGAQTIAVDWRDGLLAITFFLVAHTIFLFSIYLPDAQDAFATRTLGGVRFTWAFLLAIIFFKLFERAHHKLTQALVTLVFVALLIWSSITLIGQRQAWIGAARMNDLMINQFVNAMAPTQAKQPFNILVLMPNRFMQEVNKEPIFSTTWDITPAIKERFTNQQILARAIYEPELEYLAIQNNLVYRERAWNASVNNLYVFDGTKIESSKGILKYMTDENALRQFFVSKGLLVDALKNTLLTPGSTIEINQQLKKADLILEAGWGHIEDWGVWSTEPQARLKLPILANRASTLDFEVRAFVAPQHPRQQVEIWVNGQLQKKVILNTFEGNHFTVQVPAPGPAPNQSASIILKMPDAISPKSLGLGADNRQLGIGLQKIKID